MNRRFSVLRSYDPRTKLHILLMYLVVTAVAWNAPAMALSVLIAALVIYMSRESLRPVVSMSLLLLLLDIIIGVVSMIAMPFKYGFYTTVKLLLLTFVYLLIAKTTKVLLIILDFIPKVYREKKRGRKAQKARGISPDGVYSRRVFVRIGNKSFRQPDVRHVFSRIRQEALLAIPNVKYAFTRSKRQSEAMTRRQYLSTIRRNPVYELKLTTVDKVSTIIYMILMLVTIAFTCFF